MPYQAQLAYANTGSGAPAAEPGSAPMADAAAPQDPALRMRVRRTNGDENEVELTDQDLYKQLAAGGYNPLSMSPDGMAVKLRDQQGEYSIGVPAMLKKLGYEMTGATPNAEHIDYENVSPGLRMGVHKLADDNQRRDYLKAHLDHKAGWKDATVVGGGRDWYAHNPDNNSWIALTNSPDWDKSDLAEGALEAPRAIAAGLGGGAGALLGGGTPASIPLAMGGAGLGGGAVDVLERAGMALADPDYREQVGQNLGGTAADVGINAGLDAATGGLFEGLPQLAGAVKPALGKAVRGIMNNGVASTTARGIGKAANTAGTILKEGAGLVDNSLGREAVAFGLPGANELSSAGYLAGAPSDLARGMAKVPAWLGNSKMVRQIFGDDAADALVNTSKKLMARRPGVAAAEEGSQAAENFAGRITGQKPVQRPAVGSESGDVRDVMGNAFEGLAKKAEMARNRGALKENMTQDYRAARGQWGMNATEAKAFADAERAARAKEIIERSGLVKGAANAGETAGRYMKMGEQAGNAAVGAARGISKGVIKGAKATGNVLQSGGKALDYGGTALSPLENRALLRYWGAEENLKPEAEHLNPWRKKPARSIIPPTLASD